MRELSTIPREELEAIVGRVQTELYRDSTGWNPDKEVNGGKLAQELGSVLAQHDLVPPDPVQDTHYQGPPFIREQLLLVVRAAIAAALDQFDGTLPNKISWGERRTMSSGNNPKPTDLNGYERGVLDTLGMTLATIATQLLGWGVSRDSALYSAGNIEGQLLDVVATAWEDKGKPIRKLVLPERDRAVRALLPGVNECAEEFVDTMLHAYLREHQDPSARS